MQAALDRSESAGGLSQATPLRDPVVELVNVHKRFAELRALAAVDLAIGRGEFFSLLGPSGCGKTTLLRLIAGLEMPDEGLVRIGGRDAAGLPPHQRPVNTVFQSYALFPHLTVRENIAFGLQMKRRPAADIASRVARVMDLVRIPDLAARRPAQLSGGEKQRVALARAVINEPEVLLLDEPLGALDLKLRQQLQLELHALQRRLGITFVYVTHDQEEALVMSDRVGVMNAGRIQQLGAPQELYERPRTRFVAEFLGGCNLLAGTVTRSSIDQLSVHTPWGELEVQPDYAPSLRQPSDACTLALRPEKVSLHADEEGARSNSFRARLRDLVYTGRETQCWLETTAGALKAWVPTSRVSQLGLHLGQELWVHLPPAALLLLDD